MADSISRRIHKLEAGRRNKGELKDILAEYFSGDINEDMELARSMGVHPDEIEQLRREFEA